MKNKKLMVILLTIVLLSTSGCGTSAYIMKNKKPVTVEGHTLQKNIYCQPSEDTKMYETYKKYEKQMDVKLSKLPKCNKFKVTSNKTKSLWQFIFVKPLAYFILKLGYLFKHWGLKKAYLAVSLIAVGIIIRLILLPFTIKTQNQSKKMQQMMPEMQRIEKKYGNRTDQEAVMMKTQETMALYSKYKVNPLMSCLLAFIQLPLFFAFLQAIYKIPAIYEGNIFGWGLGITPSVGISKYHNYTYLILVVLIILTTYFSFKYTMNKTPQTSANNQATDQMKSMVTIMTIFVGLTSFSLPTAIGLYWISTYAFIVFQTYFINLYQANQDKVNNKKVDKKEKKNIREKLKMKDGMKYGKNNK